MPKAISFSLVLLIGVPVCIWSQSRKVRTVLIAHRGASAYAPEHTLAAYELAIRQGADFVEQDLQLTKDGILICLHDADLARTTDAEEVFPDRASVRDSVGQGEAKRGWYAIDFTLEEIKRLDAGSWFNRTNAFAARPQYTGQKVPTLEEAIRLIGNRARLYIEIKHFPFYKSRGFDVAERLAAALNKNGFDRPDRRSRVMIQSFFKEALLRLRELAPHYARIQLLPAQGTGRRQEKPTVNAELAKGIAKYASGVGPSKDMISNAEDVAVFHRAGLLVHPYTFRGSTLAQSRKPLDSIQPNGLSLRENIIDEIRRFVDFGVDGGFTDYPDLWKEATGERKRKAGAR